LAGADGKRKTGSAGPPPPVGWEFFSSGTGYKHAAGPKKKYIKKKKNSMIGLAGSLRFLFLVIVIMYFFQGKGCGENGEQPPG